MARGRKNESVAMVKAISPPGYRSVLGEVTDLLEQARQGRVRAVNAVMTAAYRQVGARVVNHERHGPGFPGRTCSRCSCSF